MDRCESKLALVDYEQLESDDYSSGYESILDLSDSDSQMETQNPTLPSVPIEQNTTHEKMTFRNTRALTEQLKTILSIPKLCDVKFEVGPKKIEVYGVKSILATRSRVLYNLILQKQRETKVIEKVNKKDKKKKNTKTTQCDHMIIVVNKYQPEDFYKIVEYIHCGSVDIDSLNVVGLLCGASQFGLDDLEVACWDFVEYCLRNRTATNLLASIDMYSNFKVAQILLTKISRNVYREVTV